MKEPRISIYRQWKENRFFLYMTVLALIVLVLALSVFVFLVNTRVVELSKQLDALEIHYQQRTEELSPTNGVRNTQETNHIPITFVFSPDTNLYDAVLLFEHRAHDVAPYEVNIGNINGSSAKRLDGYSWQLIKENSFSGVWLVAASTPESTPDIFSGPIRGLSKDWDTLTFSELTVPVADQIEMGLYKGASSTKELNGKVIVTIGTKNR